MPSIRRRRDLPRTMSFADTNGQHLYYEDTGWDGPAVIFSHGFLMDHDMFAPRWTLFVTAIGHHLG